MVWFVDHNNNMDLEPCEMFPTHNKLAIQKLAEYEDIGLAPQEIEQMKSRMLCDKPRSKIMECPICKTSEFVEHIDYLNTHAGNFDNTILYSRKCYKCSKCKGSFSVTIDYKKDNDEYRENHTIA